MVYGLIHPGSGLGNQLHRYVATRVLALDKGYDFSMVGRNNFKGKSFMNLDFGNDIDLIYTVEYPAGKIVQDEREQNYNRKPLWEEKTNYYNPEFNFIEDGTIIDGELQSEQYFGHRLKEIDEWLKVKPIEVSDDVCVIGFRGGEFYMFPELGLPHEYFDEAMNMMREINPNMKFEVHTDDGVLAKKFFPDFNVIQDIGINWRSIRTSRYSIIANSSFYILPRLLKHFNDKDSFTVAPRLWARRNLNNGIWSLPQNYYKDFIYI